MCVVDESVEDGVTHGGIAGEFVPGVDGVLAGDEGGSVALSVVKDLEEQSILIVASLLPSTQNLTHDQEILLSREGGIERFEEFREVVGKSTHLLNNLFSALFCQWDLAIAESDSNTKQLEMLRQIESLLRDVSVEIKSLSRAYAQSRDAISLEK